MKRNKVFTRRQPSRNVARESFRPVSFRKSALVCTTIASLLLLSITVYLHYLDRHNGAVLSGQRGDGLSVSQLFQIRYLPTILIVLYGSWITTLDLDVKRLEPWLRLSLPSDPFGTSSLLCRYDTDFILTVVAKAMVNRHWIVFASSWLVIIATVIVPAVQNSMFTTRKQASQHALYISQPALLAALDTQKDLMTNNFLLSAYSIAWLGQKAPGFSTNSYTLAPFKTNNLASHLTGRDLDVAVITASTARYWAELTCWEPALISVNFTGNVVSFDDGQGCNATNLLSYNPAVTETSDQSALYEAYLFSPSSLGWNPYLPNFKALCPNKPHLSLATWRTAGTAVPDFGPGGNAIAMFCQANYYFEPVNATLKASDYSVVSYVTTGPRLQLADTVFNRTHFEYIATSGAPPREDRMDNMTLKVDIADASYLAQQTRIQNMSVVAPSQQSNDVMIGFALGLTRLSPEQYLDFDKLSSAYTSAYQLLFVQAVRRCFQSSTDDMATSVTHSLQDENVSQTALWISQEEVIKLVPGFTIATEVLMGFICVICIYLLVSIPKRLLRLHRDPDSLAEVMLLSRSADVQDTFSRWSSASEQTLHEALRNEAFELEMDEDGPFLKSMATKDASHMLKSHHAHSFVDGQESPKHSLELSWATSGLIACLLFGAISLLISLNIMISKRNGLVMLHWSDFMQQLLLNFLPTAAATILAIYLILLCRLYAFLKPMYDLRRGGATARSTLLAKYTSIPPPFLFIEAFRARHYLLAVISVAVLLSNALTVTTASIFVLQQADVSLKLHPTSLYEANVIDNITQSTDAIKGILPGSSAIDAIYSNIANMSDLTPLPTWTTESYGFLPVSFSGKSLGEQVQNYQLQSIGYGADLQCANLQKPSSGFAGNIIFQNNGSTFQLWANFTDTSGSVTSCIFDTGFENEAARLNLAKLPSSVAALEISNTMKFWNGSTPIVQEFCANQIVKGWLRARTAPLSAEAGAFAIDYNATIIVCQPRIKTRQFLLNTTYRGDVLSAQPLEPDNYVLPPSLNLSASLITSMVMARDDDNLPEWHNDTVARDWSNYLYYQYLGNREWLDPALAPPTVEEASSVVSNIFSRIFAVQMFLDRDKLQPAAPGDSIRPLRVRDTNSTTNNTNQNLPAEAIVPTQKIFMSQVNFIVSVAILVLDLVVILVFRLNLPQPFLPRMPFTIASQIAFFSGSHVIDDVLRAGGNLKELDDKGYRYAYGQYVGKDGWRHTGIERDQFVTKL